MVAPVIGIWYVENTYKRALCKNCFSKLIPNSKILSISRAQGKFISISNYCLGCAENEVSQVTKELGDMFARVVLAQKNIENDKKVLESVK